MRVFTCCLVSIVILSSLIVHKRTQADEFVPNKRSQTKDNGGPKKVASAGAEQRSQFPLSDASRLDTVRQFFESEEVGPDLEWLKKNVPNYSDNVIGKMNELLAIKDDHFEAYKLIGEINNIIYDESTKSKTIKVEAPFELGDEAILQALNLIVPDSDAEGWISLAKIDLRKFFLEHPDLGRELLERLGSQLDSGEFQTMEAIHYLEGAYYNWIPLARLADYIEANGSEVPIA